MTVKAKEPKNCYLCGVNTLVAVERKGGTIYMCPYCDLSVNVNMPPARPDQYPVGKKSSWEN